MGSGRFPEAIARADRVVALSDTSMPALALRADIGARAGRRGEAREILEGLLSRSRHQYVPPASIAGVFTGLGDVNNAVAWLERAFDERSNAIAYLADPLNEPLRGDPRFQALLSRAGLR